VAVPTESAAPRCSPAAARHAEPRAELASNGRSALEERIQREYERVAEFCRARADAIPPYLLHFADEFKRGGWAGHWNVIRASGIDLSDRAVLDFGCKFGQVVPLLLAGARHVYALDVQQRYVDAGRSVFGVLYGDAASFLLTNRGYIPLQPDRVDFVLVNEVISHVAPAYLETVYAEIARVLRPGGAVFISDGNNLANPAARAKLLELWEKWENGPDGARTDRDVVDESYQSIRRRMIAEWHPSLPAERVEFAAANTSGLYGAYLREVVDVYVRTGDLVRRPYRRGAYPTHPGEWGVVMERGFRPEHVEMALAQYGLHARQVVAEAPTSSGLVAGAVGLLRQWHRRRQEAREPSRWRGESEGFQIIAFKDAVAPVRAPRS
jgi:SAM-dependent methyltransferase